MNGWQKLRAAAFLNIKGFSQRMTLGARVMLIDGNKILLIKHTYVPGWQFPGGGVGPGETVEAAARREVLEESGYALTGAVDLFGIYHNRIATNRDHVAFYVGRQFEQKVKFRPNFEIAEVSWFDKAALPDDVTPATSQRVDEVFDGTPLRDVWGY
ncbi:NUDIX domain-containing protein [uncultured Devosia sp.]|uniref:NUDIX domain-containing protein n=1 Tax=uncultured Devosia sp. TaxID=211434 RepID=UPI0035CBBD6B